MNPPFLVIQLPFNFFSAPPAPFQGKCLTFQRHEGTRDPGLALPQPLFAAIPCVMPASVPGPLDRPKSPMAYIEPPKPGSKLEKIMQNINMQDLEEAMEQVTDAAVHFDRDRDAVLIQSFQGSAMTPPVFRMLLNRSFHLQLTDRHINALAQYFDRDGDGTVDGAEFLLVFFRRGFAEKNRRRNIIRESNKKAYEDALEKVKQEEVDKLKWEYDAADFNFEPEDFEHAVEKVTVAAAKYDRNHPSSVSLDAFDSASLNPAQFKEQLKRVFNLKLTRKELGALMSHFDKDGDKTVSCQEFLVAFFRLGFKERAIERRKQLKAHHDAHAAKVKAEIEREEVNAQRNSLKVSYDFTEKEMHSAVEQIYQAATWYDRNSPGTVQLDAFQGAELGPAEFREQLKRVFNIKLTPKELGAAMHHFDKDGGGTIDCTEFLTEFFREGFKRRSAIIKQRRERQKMLIQKEIDKQQAILAEQEKKNNLMCEFSYTQKDMDSALSQINEKAALYDRNAPGCVQLDAFEGKSMEPHVFREQLKRVFNIRLTPPELGAVMYYFDSDNSGTIECNEFLIKFFRHGFDERARQRAAWLAKERAAQEAIKKAEEKRLADEYERQMKFDREWDEEEKRSAMQKIEIAAYKYDPGHPSAVNLEGFVGAEMTPWIFKDQLQRVFGIKLNLRELGAVMDEFDKDGGGTVSCPEFLIRFFRMGFDGRSKWWAEWRSGQRAKILQKKLDEEEKIKKIEKKSELEVNPNPPTHKIESAIEKLINAAVKHDRRMCGPAGLKGFDGATLTPKVFREQIKRTFQIYADVDEMGAFIKFFDIDGDGTVDAPEFLTMFFKTSLQAKGILSRARKAGVLFPYLMQCDEMKAFKNEIKDRIEKRLYNLKTASQKQGDDDAKARRIQAAAYRHAFGSGSPVKRTRKPRASLPAVTRQDKVQSRLNPFFGKNRLDLSTYLVGGQQAEDLSFTSIPPQVFAMSHLTELWLSNNTIKIIPVDIKGLVNLTILAVDGNQLSAVPKEVGQLSELQTLILSRNQLSVLPPTFHGLKKLRELFLDDNDFTVFPDVLGRKFSANSVGLAALERLSMCNNRLQGSPAIPAYIRNLKSLGELHLTGNTPDFDNQSLSAIEELTNLHIVGLPKKVTKGNKVMCMITPEMEIKMKPSLRPASQRKNGKKKLPALPGVAASRYFDRPEAIDDQLRKLLKQRAKRSIDIAAGRRVAVRGSPGGLHKKKSRRSLSPTKRITVEGIQ